VGPARQIIETAWTDIQARFGPLATAKSLKVPVYSFGIADVFSRMKYPALFLAVDFVRQETESILGENLSVALDLILVHTDAKPAVLQTAMLDYTDCMLELLRDDHTLGGACQIGEFQGSDLFSASANDADLAIAKISILLRTEIQI
jgi:hypothetical protein